MRPLFQKKVLSTIIFKLIFWISAKFYNQENFWNILRCVYLLTEDHHLFVYFIVWSQTSNSIWIPTSILHLSHFLSKHLIPRYMYYQIILISCCFIKNTTFITGVDTKFVVQLWLHKWYNIYIGYRCTTSNRILGAGTYGEYEQTLKNKYWYIYTECSQTSFCYNRISEFQSSRSLQCHYYNRRKSIATFVHFHFIIQWHNYGYFKQIPSISTPSLHRCLKLFVFLE